MRVKVTNNFDGPRGLTNGGLSFLFQPKETKELTVDELNILKANPLIKQYFRIGKFSEGGSATQTKPAEVKPAEVKPAEVKSAEAKTSAKSKKSPKQDEF